MSVAVAFLLFGSFLAVTYSNPNCDEFSRGATFSSEQALGTWYVINMQSNDPGDAQCVEFSKVPEQERKDLKSVVSKYVPDLKWENLVLKMLIPCRQDKSLQLSHTNSTAKSRTNRTRAYYLEKLDVDGHYKTLQIPAVGKEDPSQYGRHPMRLKIVHERYLAMMDCLENFAFVLNNKPLQEDKQLDPSIMKILQIYLPDDH